MRVLVFFSVAVFLLGTGPSSRNLKAGIGWQTRIHTFLAFLTNSIEP
jgi:hypothetical protein